MASLAAAFAKPNPDHMHVVWHQAKDRARKSVSEHRMGHQFAKAIQERCIQPTFLAVQHRDRPMHNRVRLIVLTIKSAKMVPFVYALLPKS